VHVAGQPLAQHAAGDGLAVKPVVFIVWERVGGWVLGGGAVKACQNSSCEAHSNCWELNPL